ncbi:MAG TPA: MFS transporter [Thermoplasmata archaeon]|nr:MFS transporter [Thermoplasmata archaeon]
MAGRELLSLSLYSLLASNRGGLFIVYLPLYLVELKGASLPAALAVLSLAYVPASLIGPWVGRLSDRAGRRRPFLIAGEAAAFPLFFAILFAPGYVLAGGLFIAAELALAIGGPAYSAYVADVTRHDERGYGYGLLNATSSAGGIVGFALAGTVTYLYGLGALFPFVVVVMVGTLSVVVLLVPEVKVPPSPRVHRPFREAKPVVTFSLAVSIRAIGSGAIATFYGYYAATLGANDLEIGLIAIAGLATAAVVSLPLGRMIDRRGEIRGIWYGTLLTLGSIGIFLGARAWWETVPAQAVRNAGLALVGPGMQTWVARIAPPGRRAEDMGIFTLINSSLWSIGPLVGALAILVGGYLGLFAMAIATTVVSLVVMEFLYGEMGIRARLHPPDSAAPP